MPAVAAGLAIGIAFVITFSLKFIPAATALSDEELIERTKRLEEVQLFLDLYPDSEVRVVRDDMTEQIHIFYSVERQVREPKPFDSGTVTKELEAMLNTRGHVWISTLTCGDRISMTMFHVTKDMVVNACFHGAGRASDSPPVANDDVE